MNSFNPADIENITFLEDAAAASIYGARAAGGVVIITTKTQNRAGLLFNTMDRYRKKGSACSQSLQI